MPCYDPIAAAERVEAAEKREQEENALRARVEFLEAVLCGTRKALMNVNRALGKSPLDGVDYVEMGISKATYLKEMAEHAERDLLKNPSVPKVNGS